MAGTNPGDQITPFTEKQNSDGVPENFYAAGYCLILFCYVFCEF